MKLIGSALCVFLLAGLLLASGTANAELTASVDRDRVSMGDTLRLTITATANETINNIDFRPLLADFNVLQRSTSSNTRIENGTTTRIRQVILDIMPKREGTLRIPSLRAGSDETNFLLLSVSPAPNALTPGQMVSFTAELDRNSVYVQGQVILTLRILQSINLEARSVTELQLDNAFVKPLEQNSFQRTIDGRPWLVHEIRYAVFPEESGVIEIPAQTFSARESTGRQSMLGFGGNGRQLRRSTETLSLNVLPRPDKFPGATWLPARKLEIKETWSTPPEQLRTGESATRTITIIGDGLLGAQLPPTLFPATEGLKYYPDQPVISESEISSGLQGSRIDGSALIPTQAGSWKIPEVRIPWWDTEADKVRYAVLPEREVVVTAGASIQLDSAPIAIVRQEDAPDTPAVKTASPVDPGLWKPLAIISAAGWLCTLLYLLYSRRAPQPRNEEHEDKTSERKAFKQLLAACSTDNAVFARRGIIDWCDALFPGRGVHSLEGVSSLFADPDLTTELGELNRQLYREDSGSWTGGALGQIVQQLRKKQRTARSGADQKLQLYPS